MTQSRMFSASAVVLALLGLGLLIFPVPLISARTGQTPGDLVLHLARQFGTLAFVLGLIAWRLRHAAPSKERSAIRLGLTLAFIILPVETAFSILRGSESAEGWLLVAVFGLLAAGLIAYRNDNSPN